MDQSQKNNNQGKSSLQFGENTHGLGSSDGSLGTAGVPQLSLGILLWAREDKIRKRVMACQLTQLCHMLRKQKNQTKTKKKIPNQIHTRPKQGKPTKPFLCIGAFLLAQNRSIYLKGLQGVCSARNCSSFRLSPGAASTTTKGHWEEAFGEIPFSIGGALGKRAR